MPASVVFGKSIQGRNRQVSYVHRGLSMGTCKNERQEGEGHSVRRNLSMGTGNKEDETESSDRKSLDMGWIGRVLVPARVNKSRCSLYNGILQMQVLEKTQIYIYTINQIIGGREIGNPRQSDINRLVFDLRFLVKMRFWDIQQHVAFLAAFAATAEQARIDNVGALINREMGHDIAVVVIGRKIKGFEHGPFRLIRSGKHWRDHR